MKIAFALRHYHKKGGISRSSSALAEGMAKRGHEVHIFAHSADDLATGITFHPVAMHTTLPFYERLSFARNAGKLIAKEQFDIVNNQGGAALYNQDVITARSCHRAWVEIKKTNGEYWRYLLNPLHHAVLHIEKVAYQPENFRHVISVSKGVARELTKYHDVPPEKITSIPNGADLERFNPHKRNTFRHQILAKHQIPADSVVLLFTGREFRRKGLGLIIEALEIINDPRLKLLVCGSDNQATFKKLARDLRISEQVIFTGRIDAVEQYYAASDIFVFPTLYEAFSLSTLEAAASGLPQVVTNINGTEELIVDGENGFFCEREATSVAEKIMLLVNDRSLREKMGVKTREVALTFSWDNAIEKTLAIYSEILEGR